MESKGEYTNQVESTKLGEGQLSFTKRKLLPACFSVLLIALVLSPIIENFRAKATDSFPLSHFPMFTSKREATENITHLVGLDADGNRHVIPHHLAGTGGMNQVRKQIRKSARDKEEAPKLCQTVAENVAARTSKRYATIVKVVIVSGEYNLNDYFAGAKNPVEEKIRVDCEVKRNSFLPTDADNERADLTPSNEKEVNDETGAKP